MTNPPKRYLITSALPYANGQKHVGHLAGAYIPADIYVRYLRARKRDVVFVCGSDEHGTAIPIQARKEGTTPQQIIDKYHAVMKKNFDDLSISFDVYDRTSSPLHHETAQEFFTYLNDRGDLEIKESEQYYDEEAKTFLADRYIRGTCPNCGFEKAFGDQCERCGTSLSPDELINPVSTLSGNTPVKKATQHWYLPLDKHESWLREWILGEHAADWKANVLGQCKSWIDAGLQPRAVTRDLDWGVKVPAPPTPQGGILEGSLEYETADPMTYALLKEFVQNHRSRPTQAEDALWQSLRNKQINGVKFRRQHIIGNFIADFVSLSHKLIIEVDGLIHQLPENKISDAERTEWLENKGYTVIRFTNEEITNSTERIISQISDELKKGEQKSGVSQNPPLGGGGPGKVLYVWFDAPIGYISATKQWALVNGKDWQPYWMDKETKLVHFVGKDNIVFHCIIFPVMLKLHGFILPDNVPANEFMNLEGDKMSTSRGWKVDMQDYIDDFINKENGGPQLADALRYYLTTILPENKDSEFTWKGFQDAVNSELVAVFGNFIYRTLILMHKLCGGKVPRFHNDTITEKDNAIIAEIKGGGEKVGSAIEEYRFRDALFAVIDLARSGNKYLQEGEPWIKAKRTDADGKITAEAQAEIDNCLHICLQLCANLAILVNPFLPNTAKKLCGQLKVVEKMLDWDNAGSLKLLSVGYSLREPELPFRKIEDNEITYQIEKLNRIMQESTAAQALADGDPLPVISGQLPEEAAAGSGPVAPTVTSKSGIVYDDFDKIDLRIGTIMSAEKVKKADKLLQLEVDLGFETRTIVSGIAQHFTPESLIGKQVIVVANLAPRKMKGIESNGMILTAEQPDGSLILVAPNSLTQNGSNVK